MDIKIQKKAFSNTEKKGVWGGEAFYVLVIKSLSVHEPVTLYYEFHQCF
jgi:hypothetical protein